MLGLRSNRVYVCEYIMTTSGKDLVEKYVDGGTSRSLIEQIGP